MSFYNEGSASVNRTVADREREILSKAINAAISRSRLNTNSLEVILASLRHKEATPAEIRDWLKSEGLYELVSRHMRGAS